MDNIFIQLALILGLVSIFGFLTKITKLPLVIAYLSVGLLISFTALFDPSVSVVLHFLPEIGVAFMLFLVGMDLDLREIKTLGKPILITAILQLMITTLIGSSIARWVGFAEIESWYLGVGLALSSTVVVVKILSEGKDLNSLYGKLSLGILLVKDLLAVILILILTSSSSFFGLGYQQAFPFITILLKIILVFAFVFIISKFLLPFIFKKVSDSGELLFLTALAWCFAYISFAVLLGFSVMVGAFLAGIALASSQYHYHIEGKVKPLRDFFVALFFVYLGTQVDFAILQETFPLILLFTAYALLVKPIISLLLLGIFGFRKHTMFKTAINLTQISEFSLILLVLGLERNVVSREALTTIAFAGALSITLSSILISYSDKLYKVLSKFLGFFERKDLRHDIEKKDDFPEKNHVVVIGADKVGVEIINFLHTEKVPQLVLDFNPHIVEVLSKQKVPVIYGDMSDPDVLDKLNLQTAEMVISTVGNFEDNKLLLEDLKIRNISVPVIVRASSIEVVADLYKMGADYVIVPEVLAGDFLVKQLKSHLENKSYFKTRAKLELEKVLNKKLVIV